MVIREAKPGDESAIIDLIQELAEFEKEPDAVKNTPEALSKDLFEERLCEAFVACEEDIVVAYAIFYTSYSTWKGPCLYLEDLYVQPQHRGKSIGKELFLKLVEVAKSRNFKRMDWQVLDWNDGAIEFYKHLGADLDEEWLNGRLHFS